MTPLAPDEPDLQMAALQLFLALGILRPVWGGSLVVCVGLQAPGRALALALQATGAAGLFLEDNPADLRAAGRVGSCTFTVNALEEAIRILKNEVRQRRPITVALRQQPAAALCHMLRRGLQPVAVALGRSIDSEEMVLVAELCRRGAVPFAGLGLSGLDDAVYLSEGLLPALGPRWRGLGTDAADTVAGRRLRDAELLAAARASAVPKDILSRLAVQWLRVAPSLLPRALNRSFVLPQVQG